MASTLHGDFPGTTKSKIIRGAYRPGTERPLEALYSTRYGRETSHLVVARQSKKTGRHCGSSVGPSRFPPQFGDSRCSAANGPWQKGRRINAGRKVGRKEGGRCGGRPSTGRVSLYCFPGHALCKTDAKRDGMTQIKRRQVSFRPAVSRGDVLCSASEAPALYVLSFPALSVCTACGCLLCSVWFRS